MKWLILLINIFQFFTQNYYYPKTHSLSTVPTFLFTTPLLIIAKNNSWWRPRWVECQQGKAEKGREKAGIFMERIRLWWLWWYGTEVNKLHGGYRDVLGRVAMVTLKCVFCSVCVTESCEWLTVQEQTGYICVWVRCAYSGLRNKIRPGLLLFSAICFQLSEAYRTASLFP